MKRKFSLLFAVLYVAASSLFAQSQTIDTDLIIVKENYSTEWQTYLSNSEFTIEYKFKECDFNSGLDKELLLLKISNNTSSAIDLEWQIHLFYGDTCSTCSYTTEYTRSISVGPNSVSEGVCDPVTNQPLVIFSKFKDARFAAKSKGLHKFQLANLSINNQ
jgi:hypothetical protein